jgi:very-short-patch-repair endonuclease
MEWRRKDLRRKSTLSENRLWQYIRNKQLGFRFKRQYSVSNFVVDFYCHQAKLAVEIDGDIHLLPSNRKCKERDRG